MSFQLLILMTVDLVHIWGKQQQKQNQAQTVLVASSYGNNLFGEWTEFHLKTFGDFAPLYQNES